MRLKEDSEHSQSQIISVFPSPAFTAEELFAVVTFLDDNQFNEFFLICASICQSVSSGVASIYSFC